MKNFAMIVVIAWFVLGISSADDRGYFRPDYPRNCTNVGSAALTVVAGGLNYAGVDPHAFC
jgi:hypothetical protein